MQRLRPRSRDDAQRFVHAVHDVVSGAALLGFELRLALGELALAWGLAGVLDFHEEGAAPVAHEQVETVFELV